MGDFAAADFETDTQTIRDYVDAVLQAQAEFTTAYGAALDCFQLTIQTASPKEASPDILGTVAKSGLKFAEKVAVTAVSDSTGADLGPLVEMVHAIYDETERAAKSATARSAAEFVTALRTAVINGYTQGAGRQAMLEQLQTEYNGNDEGGRGGYIARIQNELAATKIVHAPRVEAIELALYVGWINQNFNSDCVDGTGFVFVQFDTDGTVTSVTITAPLGDKLAGRLNSIMQTAGTDGPMNLDVVKKLTRGTVSMCLEGNNSIRMDTDDADAHTFLTSPDTSKLVRSFTTS
jgi:hypothetical protein